MWMSSRSQSSGTPSRANSCAIRSSPPVIAAASSPVTMPCAPSMATCALDAAMSWRHSALSKGIEALISRMIALGPSANLPPHIELPDWVLEPPVSLRLSLTVLASTLLLAACDSGADAPAQPQAGFSADKLELTGEIDSSHAGTLMPAEIGGASGRERECKSG